MVFSSEKKELWRYASRNNANCTAGAGNNRPQQLLRHQHLHRLQSPPPDYYATTAISTSHNNNNSNSTAKRLNNSQQQKQQQQQQQQLQHQQSNCNTPPPPYSSVPCGIDYSDVLCRRRLSTNSVSGVGGGAASQDGVNIDRCYSIGGGGGSIIDGKTSTCRSASSRSISSFNSSGNNNNNNRNNDLSLERNEYDDCYYNHNNNKKHIIYNNLNHYGSSTMYDVVAYDQLSRTNMPSSIPQQQQQQQQQLTTTTTSTTTATTTMTMTTIPIVVTTTASVLAATAASIFRNCCGGGGGGEVSADGAVDISTTSLTAIMCNSNNNSNSSSILGKNCNVLTPRQYFDALLKQLKEGQVTTMLKAVKSRVELVSTLQQPHCCILVHRAPILNEEPYVIACRLFFWNDLRDANELKRLPNCPNACDTVYVCCNPLHWCRILNTEMAPPPYQLRSNASSRMQLEDTVSEKSCQNGRSQEMRNVTTRQLNAVDNMQNVGLCVQFPGSLSTEGEDERTGPLIWCQLAYWELAQRVGPRFMVKKSSINVYADNPQTDNLSEGMCLKDLSEHNSTKAVVPEDVQCTRRKIGLGVTLSQEADGVWLYNRSRVPIFLHSPTLSESGFRVLRILPGECVKAFDSHRAHSLMYSIPFAGAQMGRMDKYSMRLSFAKGWGCNYKRQDITRCPCWLEVFFTQR